MLAMLGRLMGVKPNCAEARDTRTMESAAANTSRAIRFIWVAPLWLFRIGFAWREYVIAVFRIAGNARCRSRSRSRQPQADGRSSTEEPCVGEEEVVRQRH